MNQPLFLKKISFGLFAIGGLLFMTSLGGLFYSSENSEMRLREMKSESDAKIRELTTEVDSLKVRLHKQTIDSNKLSPVNQTPIPPPDRRTPQVSDVISVAVNADASLSR